MSIERIWNHIYSAKFFVNDWRKAAKRLTSETFRKSLGRFGEDSAVVDGASHGEGGRSEEFRRRYFCAALLPHLQQFQPATLNTTTRSAASSMASTPSGKSWLK